MSKPMVEKFGGSAEFSAPTLRELDHLRWTTVREFVVRTKLPGWSKDDVSVEIDEGMLVLRGQRTHGSFYRAIAVPDGVNPDTTTAILKGGFLEITIVASPDERKHARHIEIEGPLAEGRGTAAA